MNIAELRRRLLAVGVAFIVLRFAWRFLTAGV